MSSTNDPYIQLKHSQESLEFALQSGGMGTWEIDLVNNTITCSKEMLELWGIPATEFKSERALLQSVVHPDDLQKMRNAIDISIKNGTIYDLEYRILPSSEELRWVRSRGRCVYLPDSNEPQRFSGVVYDITERKMKEEALLAATKAKDQFFMMASHELRTPLTLLQLQLEVMEWDLKNKNQNIAKIQHDLKKQRDHLLRITRIVDNMLDETRISHGHLDIILEEFDLSQMTYDVVERFRIAAEAEGVEVCCKPGTAIEGKWDRFRLEQVLMNLLTNALRYGNKSPIYIETAVHGSEALLKVKDQGFGINKEDQVRVFQRFERAVTDIEVPGLGVGLYISRQIVYAHGGDILLESEPGKGSVFTVRLPIK